MCPRVHAEQDSKCACLTAVGFEPLTFGLQVQCSINAVANQSRYDLPPRTSKLADSLPGVDTLRGLYTSPGLTINQSWLVSPGQPVYYKPHNQMKSRFVAFRLFNVKHVHHEIRWDCIDELDQLNLLQKSHLPM